ncbi:MAG: hypothetical protein IKP64_12615 [Selenomonadaceae bacterium]|nr:hypothetical protein [Selenomonadaceae bacterium]MBR4384384.1 hypothetical protein [Selenomonadaceae bacterium]
MEQIQPQFTAGANSLTRTLQGMIKGISDKPTPLDFGKINDDYSLTTNSLRTPIPKDEYGVCRSVLYSEAYPLTEDMLGKPKRKPDNTKIDEADGIHIHVCGGQCSWAAATGAHLHWVELPKKMRRLKPGDKVLVAWIQNEAVVIDIVFSAKYLGTDDEPIWDSDISGNDDKSNWASDYFGNDDESNLDSDILGTDD